jgi:hypothetical protein
MIIHATGSPSNKAFQPPAGGAAPGVIPMSRACRPPRLNASVGLARMAVLGCPIRLEV